jgi:murein DD-endopeptidase MepM/ murein hydrolase activator NlpD
MSDYEGRIRLYVEGLDALDRLDQKLQKAVDLFGRLESIEIGIGKSSEASSKRVESASRRRAAVARARDEIANRGVDQGLYLRGVAAGIAKQSRINYLGNTFKNRQQDLAAGGGGARLSAELQKQAGNIKTAFDVANKKGRESLEIMQALNTEMSGILGTQNRLNRFSAGRSRAFESARRGQERIDELAARPEAGSRKISELRSKASDVIEAASRGDMAGAREATRRLNSSINRYRREIDASSKTLSDQRRAEIRSFNLTQGWRAISAEAQQMAAGPRALPSSADLAQRVARTPGGVAPVRLDELKKQQERLAAEGVKNLEKAGKTAQTAAISASQAEIALNDKVFKDKQEKQKRLADEEIKLFEQSAKEGIADFDRRLKNRETAKKKAVKDLSEASQTAQTVASSASQAEIALNDKVFKDKQEKQKKLADEEIRLFKQSAKEELADFDRRLKNREAAKKKAQASSPFQGGLRQALGEGLIGGGFPLLFGQGAGASAGGLAGGFAGGLIGGSFGFGLSIAGTAIGQAVDTTIKNLSDLAAGLKSPNDGLAALEANGFRVSDSLKFQVDQLQSVGRAYDAQTLVLQEVEKRLGGGSVRDLNALSSEQARLQDQWSSITGTLQSGLIPALVGVTSVINDLIGAAKSINDIPGVRQLGEAYSKTSPTQKLLLSAASGSPVAALQGLFQAAQERGRRISSTSAGNRRSLSPQEAYANETKAVQQSRGIADQIRSTYREAFNLQRQANDLQRDGASLNKEIADYSYRKEREIFDLRQQAAEKQIENRRAGAQNRIESGDLGARQAFASATGFAQVLLTNARETVRTRKEGEADIRQARSRFELAMARLNRDTEDYKRTTAREIEDIERRKLAYTRSVEDYRMKVADYVLQRSRESADLMRQAMVLPEVGAAGAGSAAGGSNASFIATSLVNRLNLTPAQAAGVVGNFMRESTSEINPRINEGGSVGAPARKGGYGIAQWTGSRLDDLIRFAGSAQKAGDLGVQIDFLIRELRTSEGGALRSLRSARTPEEAATVFERDFERSGIKALSERRQNARQFYDSFASGAMGGASSSVVALTGATGIGTEAHLDARWADGRPITAADVDRFIRVAGEKPSRYGVTSGYGPRQAPVPGASTFHKGIDFGTPAGKPITLTGGARLVGSMTEAQSGGGGIVGIIDTPMGQMKLLHLEKIIGNVQAKGAAKIGGVSGPRFSQVPIGPTPSAAPISAERLAVLAEMAGSGKEAQKILEEQIKLKQKGVELGQIERILQETQLPQLQQQGDALKRQVEARERIINLSDNAASIADIEAEASARLAQIERDRATALAMAGKQFGKDPAITKQINTQADAALKIAKGEEKQRKANLALSNQSANLDRARVQILQLEEGLAAGRAEAVALERGELQASTVELLRASALYRDSSDAQREKLASLVAETEELRKQNEFRKRLNEVGQEIRFAGTGVRSGFIGAPARAFEQELKASNGNVDQATQIASRTKTLEDQQVVWQNLEKDIVKTSDAISGALTNGLLDVISGSKTLADVGRETLNTIARSFADSAQQQLGVITQRQLNGLLGGPSGPLTKALGAGGAGGTEVLGRWGPLARLPWLPPRRCRRLPQMLPCSAALPAALLSLRASADPL